MNDSRPNRVDMRPQNLSARFTVHEDSDKENRGAGLVNQTKDTEDLPRFRKPSPISRRRTSGSGWVGGRHIMGERENGQSRKSVAEDTIVVEPAGKAKSVFPVDDFQDIASDGVEDESQFPEYDEEETQMVDLAGESDYEESNRHIISNEKEGSVGEERRRNSDATRNARAWSRMIKGAAPPPSPSKKRPRDIYESGASSSNEPLSPHRHVNSPPQRPAKRVCTPPSSNRRKSAPSNLEKSPVKKYENNMTLKKEPTRTYPEYIVAGIQKLREKFEGVEFEPGNGSVRCVDCDKTFNVVKRSFNGPESHCRGIAHKAALRARLEQEKCELPLLKTTSKTMDFDTPPQPPVMAMGNHGSTAFANPFADVFTALQRSSNETLHQHMAAQQRLDALEKQLDAQNGHVTTLLGISQSAESRYQAVAKKQKNTEMTLDIFSRNQINITDELRKEQAHLEERMLQQGDSTLDKLSILDKQVHDTLAKTSKFTALEDRLVKSRLECQSDINTLRASTMESTERTKQQLSMINKELTAAIGSNSEQIQDTRHDITPLNKHMNEQLQRNFDFDSKLKHHWGFISGQAQYNTQNHPRLVTLEDLARHHGNYINQLQQKVTNLETRAGHGQNFEAATLNEVKKLQESGKKLQMEVQSLQAPSTPQNQQPSRREVNQNAPNQSVLEQVVARLSESFDTKFKSVEDSFQAQIVNLQNESRNKISRLEAQTTRQTQVIQTLENENKKLWSCIQAANDDVKEVMECFNDSLPELEEKIENIQQDLELTRSMPAHLQPSTPQRDCEQGSQHHTHEDMDLEARFKRIETAIPSLLEETSDLRDCFVDLVREEEDDEDDVDVEARLNRIEVTLPAVLEEAAGLRACIDDLGEIIVYEMDSGSVSDGEDENEDQDEWEGEEFENQGDDIKEEDHEEEV